MARSLIVRTFRDLEAWQTAMDLVVACYEVARRLPPGERFVLGTQIRRAATSVPSNIAEGHATRSDGTFCVTCG
jgi:four helix bundle protein